MKKVIFSLKMPHTTYVGGIAAIINSYLSSKEEFGSNGYLPVLFDYDNQSIDNIRPTKLSNVIYGYAQKKALLKFIDREFVSGTCREDMIVHIHTSCRYLFVKDVFLARSVFKKTGVPVTLSIHVGDISTVFDGIPQFFKNLSIKWLNKYVAKTVFLSNKMKLQFEEAGLQTERSELLYNFHDLALLTDSVSTCDSEKLRLLFVGAIHRDKGIMELLTALDQLKEMDVHLDICGKLTDPSIKADFETLVDKLGDRVTLHGYVSGSQKTALYERADALVLPSYHEGFPLVILEALASGCAIISTPVGTTPEVLTDENVIWIDIADETTLMQAIQTLYNNSEVLQDMKRKNRDKGKAYTKVEHIRKLCGIYDSLLK